MRILATADIHLCTQTSIAGMSPIDAATGLPLVLVQAQRTLDWIAEVAELHQVDLVLIAGDLYERPRPSPAAEAVAAEWLACLCETAPVALLLGNHDRGNGPEAHALEPLKHLRPVRLTVIDRPEPVTIGSGGCDVRIYPVPYPSRSYLAAQTASPEETAGAMSRALDEIMLAHATAARTQPYEGLPILLGHGTLRGAAYNAYQTVPLTDVQIGCDHFQAFDLAVWGHLHQRQRAPGCTWAGDAAESFTHGYVGSPMRQDFGEEGEAHGVSILDNEAGGWRCHFVRNPVDRHFWTTGPDGLGFWDPDAEGGGIVPDSIVRVVGETSPERYDQVARTVRTMRAAGFVISNNCQVVRPERARVSMAREDRSLDRVVRAACESRTDLASHADVIVARARELDGGR